MGWKMLKGSEGTIGEQISGLGVDEIKHFAASIDGGKFAVLVYDGKKAPIGEPKIVEKEVIKEVEKLVHFDEDLAMIANLEKGIELSKDTINDLNEDLQNLKGQLKACQLENKKLQLKIAKLIAE